MTYLQIAPLNDRVGVRAAGEVNLATRHLWESTLTSLPAQITVVHLELSGLRSVDAGGAAAVAAVAERLAPNGRIILHDPPHALRRILDVLWPDITGIEVCTS
ncbi:STAS domain-containing protein [Herbidospora cretacea]|uniref:STAS domain-containing protein n=1 Tax=Herbidospora cretacea TaxID=28444 RepID=UPI0005560839|nr:STAS domain-containing protein [Herbidospora cretacea]